MANQRPPLTADEETELAQLCEEYRAATIQVAKSLRVGNPPEPARVLDFLAQEARVREIVEQIKELIGVTADQ